MAREHGTAADLALGTARLGAFWQRKGLRDGVRAVQEALESGVRTIDTADVYSRGLSERVIGAALRGRRDQAVVVTKVGQVKTPGAVVRSARAAGRRPSPRDLLVGRTPDEHDDVARCWESGYVLGAVRRSLRRLGTDHVDVLLLHSPSAAALLEGRWRDAVDELRGTGEVRGFGVSCDTADVVRAAVGLEGVSHVQMTLNALSTDEEWSLAHQAHAGGLRVMARAPFAGGRAPGVLRDGVLDDQVAAACLQLVLRSPSVATVVVGASSAPHVRHLASLARAEGSAELVEEVRRAGGGDPAARSGR